MITWDLHRQIEKAVCAMAGEKFDVITLKESHGIDVVPVPIEVNDCMRSCTLKIDGRHYDVYIG